MQALKGPHEYNYEPSVQSAQPAASAKSRNDWKKSEERRTLAYMKKVGPLMPSTIQALPPQEAFPERREVGPRAPLLVPGHRADHSIHRRTRARTAISPANASSATARPTNPPSCSSSTKWCFPWARTPGSRPATSTAPTRSARVTVATLPDAAWASWWRPTA